MAAGQFRDWTSRWTSACQSGGAWAWRASSGPGTHKPASKQATAATRLEVLTALRMGSADIAEQFKLYNRHLGSQAGDRAPCNRRVTSHLSVLEPSRNT